ncbi:MAG: hypothetical protein HYY37_05430 [Candidatus Aenigmarchaeota archaeon]|nr:hypothetical protein [Candidatus Aenigmarchaeota archaeon]
MIRWTTFMNLEYLLAFLIVALLLAISVIIVAGSGVSAAYVQEQINRSNYCAAEADCVDIGSKCPFGCHILVNKNEAAKVTALVNEYTSNCIYSCVETAGMRCFNSRCESIPR